MASFSTLSNELLLTIYKYNLPSAHTQGYAADEEISLYLRSATTSHHHFSLAIRALRTHYTHVLTLNLTYPLPPPPGSRLRLQPSMTLDLYGGAFLAYASRIEIELRFRDEQLASLSWFPKTSQEIYTDRREPVGAATAKVLDLVAKAMPGLKELHVRVIEPFRKDWVEVEGRVKRAVLERFGGRGEGGGGEEEEGEGEEAEEEEVKEVNGLVVKTGMAARTGPKKRFAALLQEN